MSLPLLIAPSILSADFARLGAEIDAVVAAGADWIHVDVMDGHFVPNITIGPLVVKAIRPITDRPLDLHLMIAPADPYIEAFAKAGADLITVHAEAGPHLHRTLQTIRSFGKKAGVALNPATPLSAIAHVVDLLDLILIMTVNPGFGGQTFIHSVIEKVAAAHALIGSRPIHLEVDGGIASETAALVTAAGADVLVAGSAVYRGVPAEYAGNIHAIRESAETGRMLAKTTGILILQEPDGGPC